MEYHLLAIALALIVVVKGAGALSLDRLVYEHVSELERSFAGQQTAMMLDETTLYPKTRTDQILEVILNKNKTKLSASWAGNGFSGK